MLWPHNCYMALISTSLIAITGFGGTCCSTRNVPGKDDKRGERETDRREENTAGRQEHLVPSVH